HGEMGNLEAILGYQGAASHGDAREVAPEIIQMPFWTPDFCSTVIQAAIAAGGFSPHDDDPVPGYEVSLAAISPRLFEAVENDIGARMWPEIRKWWPIVDYHGLRDAFVIRYALGEQEELRLHHDVAQVSASIKLNNDYQGAELEFPRQNWTNADMPVGTLIVWPSLVTHPHATRQLVSGEKFSLTVWCELPLVVD
ncbi:MAG: 2OG-Fe(II) oxygenase, partial [Actinomycetota bacterium]